MNKTIISTERGEINPPLGFNRSGICFVSKKPKFFEKLKLYFCVKGILSRISHSRSFKNFRLSFWKKLEIYTERSFGSTFIKSELPTLKSRKPYQITFKNLLFMHFSQASPISGENESTSC